MGRRRLSRVLRQRCGLPRRMAATRGRPARRAGSCFLARCRRRRPAAGCPGVQRIRKSMSRKMLIKPFRSIESAATASHNWRRRQILRAGASTLVLGLASSVPRLAWASSVLGVRVWPARDYTRVTIESDQPLQNNQQLLQGPDRLVVDLNGLDLDQELKDLVSKITPNDPQIQ